MNRAMVARQAVRRKIDEQRKELESLIGQSGALQASDPDEARKAFRNRKFKEAYTLYKAAADDAIQNARLAEAAEFLCKTAMAAVAIGAQKEDERIRSRWFEEADMYFARAIAVMEIDEGVSKKTRMECYTAWAELFEVTGKSYHADYCTQQARTDNSQARTQDGVGSPSKRQRTGSRENAAASGSGSGVVLGSSRDDAASGSGGSDDTFQSQQLGTGPSTIGGSGVVPAPGYGGKKPRYLLGKPQLPVTTPAAWYDADTAMFAGRKNGLFGEAQNEVNLGDGLMNPGAICLMFTMFVESHTLSYYTHILGIPKTYDGKKHDVKYRKRLHKPIVAMSLLLKQLNTIYDGNRSRLLLANKTNNKSGDDTVLANDTTNMSEHVKEPKQPKQGGNERVYDVKTSIHNPIVKHLYHAMLACIDARTVAVGNENIETPGYPKNWGKEKFAYHMWQAYKILDDKQAYLETIRHDNRRLPISITKNVVIRNMSALHLLLKAFFIQASPNFQDHTELAMVDVANKLETAHLLLRNHADAYGRIICKISMLGLMYQYLVFLRKSKEKDITDIRDKAYGGDFGTSGPFDQFSDIQKINVVRTMKSLESETDTEYKIDADELESRYQAALADKDNTKSKLVVAREIILEGVLARRAEDLHAQLSNLIKTNDNAFQAQQDRFAHQLGKSNFDALSKVTEIPKSVEKEIYVAHMQAQQYGYRFCRTIVEMMQTEFNEFRDHALYDWAYQKAAEYDNFNLVNLVRDLTIQEMDNDFKRLSPQTSLVPSTPPEASALAVTLRLRFI